MCSMTQLWQVIWGNHNVFYDTVMVGNETSASCKAVEFQDVLRLAAIMHLLKIDGDSIPFYLQITFGSDIIS